MCAKCSMVTQHPSSNKLLRYTKLPSKSQRNLLHLTTNTQSIKPLTTYKYNAIIHGLQHCITWESDNCSNTINIKSFKKCVWGRVSACIVPGVVALCCGVLPRLFLILGRLISHRLGWSTLNSVSPPVYMIKSVRYRSSTVRMHIQYLHVIAEDQNNIVLVAMVDNNIPEAI